MPAAQKMIDHLVSHHVRLSLAEEVDEELIGWLCQAYEGA